MPHSVHTQNKAGHVFSEKTKQDMDMSSTKVHHKTKTVETPYDKGQQHESQANLRPLRADVRANELELSYMGSQFDE
ncbi:hypothetical protein PTMSG1_06653 [Pyrenophora teres f. maculata]|nr:hypothetical protein PTMSG1_06653 [Pyrenophora teres f. maculata]